MPLCDKEDEDVFSPLLEKREGFGSNSKITAGGDLRLGKQESNDVRSPSPNKANLIQINKLLDDDDCFC